MACVLGSLRSRLKFLTNEGADARKGAGRRRPDQDRYAYIISIVHRASFYLLSEYPTGGAGKAAA